MVGFGLGQFPRRHLQLPVSSILGNAHQGATMNHKHRKILHLLFSHPEPANLAPADIRAVLGELGADLEERHGDRYSVSLGGHTVVLHHDTHSVSKEAVRQIRRFLADRGLDPARDYPV
jgi:hypothetical protein